MTSVELARKCSEVPADGEQGKATDGNQGKATDGEQYNFVFLNTLRRGSCKFAAFVSFLPHFLYIVVYLLL
jgi:hypothetical protein